MIPLQLKLRNFLSYGAHTQTINFEPYHLICLSGRNGHGKSALIDAITWAIWGQARKIQATSKADEGLVRLGETQMTVSIDFLCNGKKYRVCREFIQQNKKSHTELNFGIAKQDNSGFTSLNEKTLRTTQEKIIATIGLTYESCINSIFLRQGQSNEFSNKSAKERKQVLASILGLNRFEELRKQAMEKANEAVQTKTQIAQFIEKISQETTQKITLKQQFLDVAQKITEHEKNEKKLQRKQHINTENYQKITAKKNELILLDFKYHQQRNILKQKLALLRSTLSEWRSIRSQHRKHKQRSTLQNKQQLERRAEQLDQLKIKQLQLTEELLTAQKQHNELTHQLQTTHTTQQHTLSATCQQEELNIQALYKHHEQLVKTEQEQQKEVRNLAATKEQFEKTLTTFKQLDEKINKEEQTFERRKTFYHQFVARGNQIKLALKNLEQRQQLGAAAQTPSCPLCEQSLSVTRKHILQTKLAHQQHFSEHQMNRLKRIIPELKHILVKQHTHLAQLKQQRTERTRIFDQKNECEKKITTVQTALSALTQQIQQITNETRLAEKKLQHAQNNLQKHVQSFENYFTDNQQFATSQKKLTVLKKQQEALSYDPQEHEQIKRKLQTLQQQDDNITELLKQLSLQEQRKKNVHELCKEIRLLKQESCTLENGIKQYSTLDEQNKKIEQEKRELAQELQKLQKNKSEQLQLKGALDQQLKNLEQREKELTQLREQIKQHESNSEDYQEIAQALSKNGIQALLIENALPEIEHEANNLLSKLTNNQSHIIIESLRDLKSGGTRETLDIKISDALGIRPYELFSGGEAFRIDFALRIAISKLLARRSGTSLQTLIIDEGFGSQDEDGLTNIMEALYKIQDEFAKIIIVSHLPTMKDQFPTHFFVNKSATGSSVTVLEQG